MRKFFTLLISSLLFSASSTFCQATLPDFSLYSNNGNVSVLWLNEYPKQVSGISVQRAFDSTGQFTSIASVFNPENDVNGFTDANPPYERMYYRLFIGFDSGGYVFTKAKRADLKNKVDYSELVVKINALYEKNIMLEEERLKAEKAAERAQNAKKSTASAKNKIIEKAKITTTVTPDIITEVITYPSKFIFTNYDGNVIVKLSDIKESNYRVKFFTEDGTALFEIKHLPDEYTTLEKVNFKHSGWFTFEIYKDEILLEKNKFYISKEIKK